MENQPKSIPMPFFGLGGRIVLTVTWWIFRVLSFRVDQKPGYRNTVRKLNKPWKVMAWLFGNVKYTSDKTIEDQWQPAEVTFNRRRGDCEDWAIFAVECLKDYYNCQYLCMYTRHNGHATCLIKGHGDKHTSIGTFGLVYHKGSIPNIIPDWKGYTNWNRYVLKDENQNIKTMVSLQV